LVTYDSIRGEWYYAARESSFTKFGIDSLLFDNSTFNEYSFLAGFDKAGKIKFTKILTSDKGRVEFNVIQYNYKTEELIISGRDSCTIFKYGDTDIIVKNPGLHQYVLSADSKTGKLKKYIDFKTFDKQDIPRALIINGNTLYLYGTFINKILPFNTKDTVKGTENRQNLYMLKFNEKLEIDTSFKFLVVPGLDFNNVLATIVSESPNTATYTNNKIYITGHYFGNPLVNNQFTLPGTLSFGGNRTFLIPINPINGSVDSANTLSILSALLNPLDIRRSGNELLLSGIGYSKPNEVADNKVYYFQLRTDLNAKLLSFNEGFTKKFFTTTESRFNLTWDKRTKKYYLATVIDNSDTLLAIIFDQNWKVLGFDKTTNKARPKGIPFSFAMNIDNQLSMFSPASYIDTFCNIEQRAFGENNMLIANYNNPLSVTKTPFGKLKYQLYPNPCNEVLNISGLKSLVSYQVEIMDMQGNRLENFTLINKNQIDIRHLRQGSYTITIKSLNDFYVNKFIKI